MPRRVVITGMGCVTPLGSELDRIWNRLTEGRSGIGRLTLFDASRLPVQIAAQVNGWSLEDVGEDPARWSRCPRQTRFAIGAALKAYAHAGLADARIDPDKIGISLGCGEPFEEFSTFVDSVRDCVSEGRCDPKSFVSSVLRLFNPETEREYEPQRVGIHLAGLLNIQGPVSNRIAACASSTQAIGEAARLIRRGTVNAMLCGGAHSTIHPFGLTGFYRLSALSTRNSDPAAALRPFDRERDGFVMGEGAAMLVLEELDHARARGAEILAELSGFGSAQDAYRITDSHPQGRGTVAAIETALKDARLNPDDIDYINAHGTGTVMNDKIETLALKRVFGAHAYQIPVSSSKSMMGHATTACGAIELSICVMTLRRGLVHPTINYHTPDAECDLDYVPNAAREVRCRHVLSPSIGFGGQNAALIVSRFDERCPSIVARKAA